MRTMVTWWVQLYFYGSPMDLWEMYRQPGYDIVCAEDWQGDLPLCSARSRGTPISCARRESTAICRRSRSWSWVRLRTLDVHHLFLRTFHARLRMFDFIPTRRASTAELVGFDHRHRQLRPRMRDLAQVEDILMDGHVLPAAAPSFIRIPRTSGTSAWSRMRSASTWPTSMPGIPLDIVTEQDVVDGLAKDYGRWFVSAQRGADALAALDAFAQAGGTLVCGGRAHPRRGQRADPAGERAPLHRGRRADRQCRAGTFMDVFAAVKALDQVKWNGAEIGVYCRKWKLSATGRRRWRRSPTARRPFCVWGMARAR